MSNKGCFIGVAVFVGLCLIIAIIAGGNSSNTNSANEDSAAIVLDSVESVDVTNDNVTVTEDVDWVYTSEKDEMTDKVSTYATLKSENIVDFDFPYNGGSYMTLSVRKSPKYGTDVYIHISKGQFISNEYNEQIRCPLDLMMTRQSHLLQLNLQMDLLIFCLLVMLKSL